MQQLIAETVNGVHVPWGADRQALAKTVCDFLGCHSFAVGIISQKVQQEDELLAAHEWPMGADFKDKLLTTALKNGIARSQSGNCVVVTLAESVGENRHWWFAVDRDGDEPFSKLDQQKVQLLLRRWQTLFLMPDERDLGRIIIGHDNRLMAADLESRNRLLAGPNLLNDLVTSAQQVAQQRYPDLKDNQSHDVALLLGRSPWSYGQILWTA